MGVITKNGKESVAWDFCNSFGSYMFSFLEREREEEWRVRSELDTDYLPNMVLSIAQII